VLFYTNFQHTLIVNNNMQMITIGSDIDYKIYYILSVMKKVHIHYSFYINIMISKLM